MSLRASLSRVHVRAKFVGFLYESLSEDCCVTVSVQELAVSCREILWSTDPESGESGRRKEREREEEIHVITRVQEDSICNPYHVDKI